MNRYSNRIDRFLTENFPTSIRAHSEDSHFGRTHSATFTIMRMANRPEITSVLFISDLKDGCTRQGINLVELALFAKGDPVRLYIITLHRPPSPLLGRLVRISGGEVYDYSDDFDLTWRGSPSVSN